MPAERRSVGVARHVQDSRRMILRAFFALGLSMACLHCGSPPTRSLGGGGRDAAAPDPRDATAGDAGRRDAGRGSDAGPIACAILPEDACRRASACEVRRCPGPCPESDPFVFCHPSGQPPPCPDVDCEPPRCAELDEEACLDAEARCRPKYCALCGGPVFVRCLEPDEPTRPCPRPDCRCETSKDEASCRTRPRCHPEFVHVPGACACPGGETCPCFEFAACRAPETAVCFGQVLCDALPPSCPGDDWFPTVEGGCWSGLCAPIDLCVF